MKENGGNDGKKDKMSTFGHGFSDFEMMAIIVNDNKVLKKKVLERLHEAKNRAKALLAPESKKDKTEKAKE